MSAVILGAAPVSAQQPDPPKGFTALFNGKNVEGWVAFPNNMDASRVMAMSPEDRQALYEKGAADIAKHWTVENGELVNDGHGMFLTTKKNYRDFELLVDYKTVARADSGIYLRGVPQVQIWDSTDQSKWGIGADKGSGGLWNNSPGARGKDPLALADKPFGEWNRFRIRMIGERVTVHMNDQLIVDNARMENYWDRKRPIQAVGPIRLQTHGGEIRWRNIFIREISGEEITKTLSADKRGFHSVFNGRDLDGWDGSVDSYEVVDGAIRCRKGSGGNLFTKGVYRDFVARLEFKLPPGGNNGLAVRYPGKGNPAYQGMTELQVLDSEHPKYARLDKRQYHGSAYGMIAAHRGFLRPAGEWNFQEVTVVGSRIKVELNGTVILNGDVEKVSEYMAGSPHPGKMLRHGHFGFAGHNDPVEFRNISLKRL